MSKQHLKIMSHLLGGLLTILLAFQFYENRLFDLMKLYIAIGCLFILVAALSNWLEKVSPKLSLVFFIAQAVAFFYAAGTLRQEEEDKIVTITIGLGGLLYLGLIVYFIINKDPSLRRRRSHKRRNPTSTHPRQVT